MNTLSSNSFVLETVDTAKFAFKQYFQPFRAIIRLLGYGLYSKQLPVFQASIGPETTKKSLQREADDLTSLARKMKRRGAMAVVGAVMLLTMIRVDSDDWVIAFCSVMLVIFFATAWISNSALVKTREEIVRLTTIRWMLNFSDQDAPAHLSKGVVVRQKPTKYLDIMKSKKRSSLERSGGSEP